MDIQAKTTACLLVVAAFLPACFNESSNSTPAPDPPAAPNATQESSDVARQWFDLLYDAVQLQGSPPPTAARTYGYAGITLYEAVVPGTPKRISLSGQLAGLPTLPTPGGGVHHWPSAANAAVADMLRELFATGLQANLDAIDALEAALDLEYDAEVSAGVRTRSVDWGRMVAQELIAWSQTDGYSTQGACVYVPPVGPGLWEPTGPAFAPPLLPCWGDVRTFALVDGTDCTPIGPPAFDVDPLSVFYSEALEVYVVTENLTAEQLAIAQFWADNPGATGTPAGHWVRILSQVAEQQDLSLAVAAEGFAKIGIGMHDSFVTCWNCKYLFNLLRPVTFIQDEIDPLWTSPVGTPPFPEYTSGHSTQSGAASWLLQDLLGLVSFTDDTHNGVHASRDFTSFLEAADEAAISRLYGGIHYRAAIEEGIEQGRCVALTVLSTLQFEE